MAPTHVLDDEFYTRPRNIIYFRQLPCGPNYLIIVSNFINNFFGKFCISMLRALCLVLTSLSNHIKHILFLSPKKKMLRINATRIITRMTDIDPFWNFSKMHLIRNSMCFFISQSSIIASIFSCTPPPTFICFFNFRPKFIHRMPIASFRGGVQ